MIKTERFAVKTAGGGRCLVSAVSSGQLSAIGLIVSKSDRVPRISNWQGARRKSNWLSRVTWPGSHAIYMFGNRAETIETVE
jgi:hypothetical protein